MPVKTPRTPEDDLHNRLFFRLFQASNIYERKAQQRLNFSPVQGALLGALSQEPVHGIAMGRLVDFLSVSRQNLDGVLKRLEVLGYVTRSENKANRRIRIVRLTPSGLAAWESLINHSLVFYREGTAGLDLDDKARLVDTLGRLGKALKSIE